MSVTFYVSGQVIDKSGTPRPGVSLTVWDTYAGGNQFTNVIASDGLTTLDHVVTSSLDSTARFYLDGVSTTVFLDDGSNPRTPVEPMGLAQLLLDAGGIDLATVQSIANAAAASAITALGIGAPNGLAQLNGSGVLTAAQTPGTSATGVTSLNGVNGVVTSATAGILPGITAGAVNGAVATWVTANSRFEPVAPANQSLPTFQLKGIPTVGQTSSPGYKFTQAITINAVDIQSGTPVRTGTLGLTFYKNGVSLASFTIADGKLRATPGASLGWSFVAEDILSVTVTSVGSLMPGGNDLIISFLSTGTFSAVGSAPPAPASVTVTGSAGNYTVTIVSGGGSPTGWQVVRDYDSTPVTAALLPVGTLTWNDTTPGTHTFAVAALNASAASAQTNGGTTTGVTYNGSVLVPTGTSGGGSTGSAAWIGNQLTSGVVTVNGTASDWAADGSSNGSKIYRTGGGDGMNASLTDCTYTLTFKFINTGAGFYIKTRGNGTTDSQRIRCYFNGNLQQIKLGYRKPGDPVTTDLTAVSTSAVTRNTTDFFRLVFHDNPTNAIYEAFFWNYTLSQSLPAAMANANGNANFTIASVPAGNVGFEDGHGGVGTSVEVVSIGITPG